MAGRFSGDLLAVGDRDGITIQDFRSKVRTLLHGGEPVPFRARRPAGCGQAAGRAPGLGHAAGHRVPRGLKRAAPVQAGAAVKTRSSAF